MPCLPCQAAHTRLPPPSPPAGAFASWRHVADAQLRSDMAGLLHSFKQAYGGQWQQMEGRIDPQVLGQLRQMYGL